MNGTVQPMSSGRRPTRKTWWSERSWFSAAMLVFALVAVTAALTLAAPAGARADACADVGGRHVSAGGCSDVAGTVEQYAGQSADPADESTAPAPAGSVNACTTVGRHINVSGCVGSG